MVILIRIFHVDQFIFRIRKLLYFPGRVVHEYPRNLEISCYFEDVIKHQNFTNVWLVTCYEMNIGHYEDDEPEPSTSRST